MSMVTRGRTRKPGAIEDMSDRRYPLITPAAYTDLALWYDWSQQTEGRIASIADLSGNSKTGTVSNGYVDVVKIEGMNSGVMSQNSTNISFSSVNVFTVIRVFRRLTMGPTQWVTFFLSDSSNYNFHGADSGALCHGTYAHANVRGGSWRFNGTAKANPTTDVVYTHANAGKIMIVSCTLATGALSQNRIGFDRSYTPNLFILCEDIIYSAAKSAAEVKALEHSLAHKWKVTDYNFA